MLPCVIISVQWFICSSKDKPVFTACEAQNSVQCKAVDQEIYKQIKQYVLAMMEDNLLTCHWTACLPHEICVVFVRNYLVDLRNILMLFSYQPDKIFS
jgi:hypothetical protein